MARHPLSQPRRREPQDAQRVSYLAGTDLRASGETARRREPSTLDQLTPRERTIAEPAASGLTNPEPRVSALPRARPGRQRNVLRARREG